jgi:NAD(P)-dependent dehydrogenase (short-subunit alcohol dehydrogenase family)
VRRLEGRIAIVTGGAGGIGTATAVRLTDEGARVVVADIDGERAERVAKQLGGEASAFQFDAGDATSIEALVEATVSRYGRLDILHNNAALTAPEVVRSDTTAPQVSLEVWDAVMNVNLRGYLVACKLAIPHMLQQGGGAIINTASGSGLVGDLSRIAYGTSKAGILSLTRYVATQHGREGIRCNAIAPGLIVTESTRSAVPELLSIIAKHVLTPRLGKPEDVAALVAFLASDEAGFINGETICCNGGSLIHQPHMADLADYQAALVRK